MDAVRSLGYSWTMIRHVKTSSPHTDVGVEHGLWPGSQASYDNQAFHQPEIAINATCILLGWAGACEIPTLGQKVKMQPRAPSTTRSRVPMRRVVRREGQSGRGLLVLPTLSPRNNRAFLEHGLRQPRAQSRYAIRLRLIVRSIIRSSPR